MVKNSDDIIISKGNKYSKVIDLLYSAKQSGIDITLNKDQLQLRIHEDKTVDEKLLQEIKNYKPLIIEFLGKRNLKSEKIDNSYNKIKSFDRGEIKNIPLSFSQERLWFIDQMEGSVQYHIPDVLRLKGKLNKDALKYALLHIVNRHEILRTVIRDLDGVGYQYVEEKNDWELNIIDGTQFREDKAGLQKYIKALINEPFNLSEDHLIRVRIIKLDEEEHVLLIVLHHIASDAWSKSILVKEVGELYRSYVEERPAKLPKLTIQYADFAVWQRSYLHGEILDNKIAYWKEKLHNVAALNLPTDFSRPAIQTSNGATLSFKINKEIFAELQALSTKSGTTLFMTILAGLQVLLYRYSGQEDICVGTPIAGRQQPEVEGLIGFFINTLALRSEVKGNNSFSDLLEQVKNTTMEAYDHQDVPFEKIVETVVKERDLSRNPLFQVMLVLQNTPEVPRVSLGELTLSKEGSGQTAAKFDLNFIMHETQESLRGSVQFNTDLYKQDTVERMIVHFEELLSSIVKDPKEKISNLDMLTAKEEVQLLEDFNNTNTGFLADRTVINLFEEQVNKSGNNTALVYEDKEITYKELDDYSNKIARHLIHKGVKEEMFVPICIERGFEMVAGIFGILKAGGAYVPIDPEYPADRISYMLKDTGAKLILASKKSRQKLTENLEAEVIEIDSTEIIEESTERLQLSIKPNSLAYVIYTSGSTGKPKGVMIEHSSLINYLTNSKANYIKNDTEGSGSFLHLSFTFDGSLTAIFMPLVAGKAIVIASDKSINVFEDENLQKYAPFDFIKITPSHLELLSEIGNAERWLTHTLVIGGEALYPGHFKAFVSRGIDVDIVNEYGPTEATVGCSTYRFSTLESNGNIQEGVPIGKPMNNVKMYILNEGHELQPLGAQGEIYIGGAGIARGYLNRNELTKERFIKNPFSAKDAPVLYKTGDIGRWLVNGDIEYAGRTDDQVKIRGYRIELGEIENEILQSGLVQQVVVLAVDSAQGERHLAGYFVPEETVTKAKLTDYLQRKLPAYMIPSVWIEMEQMPLTPNGKIDKKALPHAGIGITENEYVGPGTELEHKLADIWQQMLRIEKVGIHDNFFELGGHSLLAMRMVSAVRKQLSIEMPVKNLFLYPTVAKLALQLQGNHTAPVVPAIVAAERPDRIPLSFSQERLWFIDQMEGSLQYHIPVVLRLKGKLDKEALKNALKSIVNRHEILRTVFTENNGEVWQQVGQQDLWVLKEEDGLEYKEDKKSLHAHIQQLVKKPFDLSKDDMLRANLINLSEEENILVVTMHHIASDGWSMPILMREVTGLYNAYAENKPVDLMPLGIQYADYSIWQRDYLKGERLEKKISYWKEKLNNVARLELPVDYQRPLVQSTKGASVKFSIEKELSEELQSLSQRKGTTLFMTMLAALNVLLYRYSGQRDICVGSPVANRMQEEVEGLIGFFVNTLALRTEINGDESFTKLLAQVRVTTMEAYDNQDVPFEKIVESVVKERDLSRSPLFQVMLVLQSAAIETQRLELGSLELSREALSSNTAKFDLTFSITENAAGLHGSLEYNTTLYRPDTIGRMILHFEELLKSIVKNPQDSVSSLKMLTAKEEDQLLKEFNDTAVNYPKDKTIIDSFEEQVKKAGNNIAVLFEEEELTYTELNERSNQLAHYLRKKGVKEDTLVPICIERSFEMIIGILGILKSGGAYVPIDPEYPLERISYMLEDTGASMVLSSTSELEKLSGAGTNIEIININENVAFSKESIDNLASKPQPHHLAYVIYTSGSTGKPKGAMNEHKGIFNRLSWAQEYYKLTEGDAVLQKTTFCFDVSVWELIWPLLAGSKLVFAKPGGHKDPDYIRSIIDRQHISMLHFVPPMLEVFLGQLGDNECKSLKKILCSGEALKISQAELCREKLPHVELHNLYGPTEAAIDVTYWSVDLHDKKIDKVPIGKPVSNTSMYILDKQSKPVPIGVAGELYIGGVQVGRGYLNRNELTSEKFVKNPFIKDAVEETRMYKTGDIGKWLPDGNIEYLGRIDDQVKIRGYRIELGEIESVIVQSGLVKQAVVLTPAHKSGQRYLAGYVIPDGFFDREKLSTYLHSKLPEYMIPAVWIEMEQMPLTTNGKIDRKALPEADASEMVSGEYIAPENELENQLVAIWQELLGVERIGVIDNFFELGGHSLLAMRLVSAVRRQLEIEMGIKDLFLYPNIRGLVKYLREQGKGMLLPQVKVQNRPENIPLSYSQERLWFIDQLEGSIQYHIPMVLRLRGKLNKDALSKALQEIVNRHEVLRTVFKEENGQASQQVQGKDQWGLKEEEGLPFKEDKVALQQFIRQQVAIPFDLQKDHMLRATLITLGEEEYVLVVTMHHIASDGWSMPILVREVTELYKSYSEDKPVTLVPLEIQYADYAIWQREYLRGEILEKKIDYWKEKLSGVTGLQLPTDYPRPAIQSMRGSAKRFTIAGELSEQLQELSRQEGTTMFMTLLAVMNILLYRYSGQEDICIGSPIANRTQSEVESLIGFFVNTLALRSEVKGEESFKELLQQVKATTLGGYQHQEVPFEKVVEAVVKERDLSRSPLFQVMFMVQDTSDRKAIDLGGLALSGESSESQTSKFELTFSINDTGKGMQCSIEYNTDLYKQETIERMIGHFKELLTSIIKLPGEKISKLPMLTATEEDQLLKTFNDTASDYPKDKNIADLFEEQAAKTPQSIALIYEEEELTYGELNERSSQLARYLQKKGVREETLVPICVERGIGMMVGILGILKSGGAYVPIDPEYPQDRISYMLEDTAAAVIVSSKAGKEKLPAKAGAEIILIDGDWDEISKEESSNLHVNIASNNLAYVIYTSGSTGKPKGVLVEQGNVVSLVKGINYVSLNNEDKLLSTGSSSFDATTFEYWGMLLNGGQLILCEEAKLLNSELLKKEIERRKVSKMWFTSSWFNQLVENDISIFENLQTILAGGEKLSEQHIRKIRQTYPGIEIINGYGPTENTTFSLTYTITETEITNNIPIGRPLNNRHAYIMNDSGQLAPVGVPGEIYLGGAGLARGYLNREELTAERFIENPFASAAEKEEKRNPRLYKTGDIGKWLPDGNIEYLGRADDQVKLRGYRIELGEIESVIAQSGLVKHAVVMAPTHKTGHRYLAGYVVAEGTFNKEALNTYLHSKLPEYMIPAVWIELEQMPLTSNGKIDKKALALPDAAEQLRNEYVAPGNELEEQLTEIWQELLGTERVGVTDNFFELGGDSILTIQVVSRARRLGYELKPRDLFIHQTIAKLSPVIAGRSDAVVSGEQGLLKGAAGLLPIQQWYLEDSWKSISHFNQSVLLGIDKNISPVLLGLVFDKLVSHHDALRFKYFQKEGKWHQEYGTNSGGLITEDLRSVEEGQLGIVITKKADMHQRSLDIYKGDLIRMVWMQTPDTEKQNRLLIIVHHLAIDGVSWRILVENIEYLITELQNNPKADLGVKSTSYRQWYEALKQYGELPSVLSQINYWENVLDSYRPLATYKFSDEKITAKDICNETMVLEPLQTNQLLKDVPKTYNTAINDILLCALSMTLSNWGKTGKVVIGLEGHGREEIANDVDISRTVGWFTNLYPVLIEMDSKQQDVGDMIKSVKAQLRQVPDKGLGFGILKYINKEKKLEEKALWNVVFNYLGQLDTVVQAGKLLTGARESAGQSISDEFLVKENLSVNGSVKGGRLILGFRYNSKNYEKEAISGLIKNYKSNLELLIDHCIEQQKNGLVFTADSISEPETNLQRTQISVTKRISNKYLVPIKITGEKIPLYIVAGGGGTARKFMNFAKMLDTNQPVYCLQSPLEYADIKDFPGTIEEMASRFVEEIIQQDPHGPFSLAGHCTGGLVALEIARQLKEKGKTVHSLVMFDTIANRIKKDNPENTFKFYHVPVHIKRFISKVKLKLEFELFLLRRHKKKAIEYKINSLKSFIKKIKKDNRNIEIEMGALEVLKYSEKIYSEAHRNYKCLHYDGEIVLFYAKERNFFTDADNNIKFKRLQLDEKAKNRWGYYADSIKIHELEGEHSTIFENEMTKEFATTLQKYLNDELQ